MSDYGLTPTGFFPKRLDQILEEINSSTMAIFGDNINLSPESPDGQLNGTLAEAFSNLWFQAFSVYSSFIPNAAQGVPQSNLYLLNGITRIPATYSTVTETFTGSVGTLIPAGFEVQVINEGAIFSTIANANIGSLGTVDIPMQAVEPGPDVAVSGTLTKIVNPIVGVASAINVSDAMVGQAEETDQQFRVRQAISTAKAASNISDALYANLLNLPGVIAVRVYQNRTDVVDANGLPPHSYNCVILGGDNQQIAQTIWLSHPTGIPSFGSVFTTIIDSQGFLQPIYFDRPTPINIYVIVNTNVYGTFPSDGIEQIQNAIINEGSTFFIGALVLRTTLAAAATTEVVGHSIQSFFIGLSPSPTGRLDIQLGIREIAIFTAANITVNVS